MRESLICIGKIGEKGYYLRIQEYRFSPMRTLLLYESAYDLLYSYTSRRSLLAYIRDELDLDKLSKQLSKLLDPEKDQMKYFAALFREGHYFNEDEIRVILDEYED